MREYFYLDTCTYRDVIEKNITAEESILRYHRKRLKLAATTVIELVQDLKTCPADKFATARKVLNFARETGRHAILPIHEEFLAQRLFHTNYRSDHLGSREIGRWLDVAVRYRSKAELGKLIQVGPLKRALGLDISGIENAETAFCQLHVKMIGEFSTHILEELGVTTLPRIGGPVSGADAARLAKYFDGKEWKHHYVGMWAKSLGSPSLSPEQLDEYYPALQAACEFLSKVLLQSLRDKYNFVKNANDATDEGHLMYLCDPSFTFVTQDQKLRDKLSSGSLSRVITLDQFKTRIK